MRINILLLFVLFAILTYAQSGKKLLPHLMESDDNTTRFELSYDNQNRLTDVQFYFKSPNDSTYTQVMRKEIGYKNDSLIILNSSTRVNDSLLTDSLYSKIYYKNGEVRIEVPDGYKKSMTLDTKNRLIATEYLKQGILTSEKYEYDDKGEVSLVEISTTFPAITNYKGTKITYEIFYPKGDNYKKVFENINTSQWLLSLMFPYAYPYLCNANHIKVKTVILYTDGSQENAETSSDLEYIYNVEGYPLSIIENKKESNKSSIFRIYYIEAK